MKAVNPEAYSTDYSDRTVVPRKNLTDPQSQVKIIRVLRDRRCPDCRNGTRKTHTGKTVTCKTCDGHGRMESYTISHLAIMSGVTLAKTYDVLLDLQASGAVAFESRSDVWHYWAVSK